MPSYTDVFPERWLRADHLENQSKTVTIIKVTVEALFNPLTSKNENRLVATIAGMDQRLVINKTNAETLAEATQTKDYTLWKGLQVTLTPGKAHNGKSTIKLQVGASGPPQQAQRPSGQQAAPTQTAAVNGGAGQCPQCFAPAGKPHTKGCPNAGSAAAPVHGLVAEPVLHGQQAQTLVHGPAEEEVAADGEYSKRSGDLDLYAGEETGNALFFSVADLIAKCKELHISDGGPMNADQHKYVSHRLAKLTGGAVSGEEILSALIGRPVTAVNVAGHAVGLFLYQVISEPETHASEIDALRDLTEDLRKSRK